LYDKYPPTRDGGAEGRPPAHTRDRLVAELARAVVSGEIPPGRTLPPEMELRERFGVSRTVVREAIQALSSRGLVEARRRIGTVVRDPSDWNLLDPEVLGWVGGTAPGDEFLRDLVEARMLVEPAAAALAAERATARDAADLEAACQAMVAAGDDDDAWVVAALDFHLGLFAAAHNAVFRRVIPALRVPLEAELRFTRRVGPPSRRAGTLFLRVAEAIRLRRPDDARAAMEALARATRDEVTTDPAASRWTTVEVAPPAVSSFPAALDGRADRPSADVGLVAKFRALFGTTPRVFRAPGRVNLIGEHTDHAGGYALPTPLHLSTWAAIAPRSDRRVRIHTDMLSDAIEFDLDEPGPRPRRDWSDYVRGTAIMLERAGLWLTGADLLLRGDVPVGAGLGSSAALEMAVARALTETAGLEVDAPTLIRCCLKAENDFVGLRCGVMDQFAARLGAAGMATLLDCRSLAFRHIPLDPNIRLVLCNTMVRHQLAGSEYNERRRDCERGVAILSERLIDATLLRDVTTEELEDARERLPDRVFRRCRHVVSENARVLDAATALEIGDMERLGRLMGESHRSLRNDYQVSCPELDLMVEIASEIDGVFGARMTGGGFGGCTVNLVRAEAVSRFKAEATARYERKTGRFPTVFTNEHNNEDVHEHVV